MTHEKLDLILRRFPANRKEGLIPILQEVQNEEGFLTDDLLVEVGRYLSLPANKVYGVATFYDQFRFVTRGKYHIRICRGSTCHLHGSVNLLEELEKNLKVRAGTTTKDRKYSLEICNCMGACDSSPVIIVNDVQYTHVTTADLDKIIRSLKEKSE